MIVIADIQHLLRRLPNELMYEFLERLLEFGELVHDARMARPLHGLQNEALQGQAALARWRQSQDRLEKKITAKARKSSSSQTAAAREMSEFVRFESAQDRARELAKMRDELLSANLGHAPSFADIARLANERGYLTSRGFRWTSALVSRALTRL